MIPERDDFWLAAPPRPPMQAASASAGVAPSAAAGRLHCSDNNDEAEQMTTAWSRYRCCVEAMESRGEKFDQRLLIESMFRGKDLVYSAAATS